MYKFDYFYGNEAEQYQFYMIPQLLFTDEKFKKLSSDAKVLYSLLLDRSGLSFKNQDRFQDEYGRTFIFFTQETAMEMLNCATEKVAKIFKELEIIGLIERKRQGLGKPTKIYVKHFNRLVSENNTDSCNHNTEFQEIRKSNFKKFENRISRNSKIEFQEVRKSNTNQTNLNQTDFIHTDINQTIYATEEATEEIGKTEQKITSKIDRQTNNKTKSLDEILHDIGYKGGYIHAEILNDENGLTDTMVSHLKECSIPKEYHKDTSSLREAINIFVEWNYAYNGFREQSDKDLFSHIVETIYSLMTKDTTRFRDKSISYSAAFDSINRKIQTHGELYSWIVMAMTEWKSVVSRTKIKNVNAYMTICIWNWLSSSELEVKNNSENYASIYQNTVCNTKVTNTSYDTQAFTGMQQDDYLAYLQRNMP